MASTTSEARVRLSIDGKEVLNSYTDLNKQTKKLRKEMKGLETGSDEYIKKSQQLNQVEERMASVGKNIKETGKEWKKQGAAFKEGITERVGGITLFGTSLGSLTSSFGLVTKKVGGTSKALKFLKVAMISTGIGAIVIGIASLVAWLTKSQKGMDFMAKASAVLGAVLNTLLGYFVGLGEAMYTAFSNPKEALTDFLSFLKDQVMARVEGFLGVFKGLWKAMTGDVKGGLEDAGNSLVKMVTSAEPAELAKSFDKVKDAIAGVTTELNKAVESAAALADIIVHNRELNRLSQLRQANLSKEAEMLRIISDDDTRGFAEREEAAEAARIKNAQLSAERVTFTKRHMAEIAAENAALAKTGMLTDEAKQKAVDATVAVIEAEKEAQNQKLEIQQIDEKLKQDKLEKDLDVLIDGYDNQKMINERIIADQSRPIEERKKLLEETKKLGKESFDDQIATLDEFKGKQINADELLKESNATLLLEKIRALELSEIGETRLLEVIRDRRTAELDLAEATAELGVEDLAKKADLAAKQQENLDTNFANELAILEEQGNQKFAILQKQLAKEHAAEVAAAEKSGADVALVENKFAAQQSALNKAKRAEIADGLSSVLGDIKNHFGEQSKIGKAAAIAEATINTYRAAQAAYAAMIGVPVVGPVLAPIAAGVAVAAGLKNVQEIAKTPTTFFHGGDTGNQSFGSRDQYGPVSPGMVHNNEFVIPKSFRSDPSVANTESLVENGKRGVAPPEDNTANDNTMDRLTAVLELIEQNGVESKFSTREFERGQKGLDEKNTTKDRAKLTVA